MSQGESINSRTTEIHHDHQETIKDKISRAEEDLNGELLEDSSDNNFELDDFEVDPVPDHEVLIKVNMQMMLMKNKQILNNLDWMNMNKENQMTISVMMVKTQLQT